MGEEERAASGADASATGVASAGPTFVKKRNRANIRKRDDAEDAVGEESAVPEARQAKRKGLAFSSQRADKAEVHAFEASRMIQQSGDQGATRQLQTETEFDRDGRALREKVLQAGQQPAEDDGKYRGQAAYKDYRAGFRMESTIASEKGRGAHGPLRASTAIRSSVRFDYQPDVCKDYKETGYCGWGDACKFLHTREDYKSGWQIELEWQEEQKRKAAEMERRMEQGGASGSEEEGEGKVKAEDDDLPFACLLCRQPWAEVDDPVVTLCKHYFCEHCALKHNASSKVCAQCGEPTKGIFNVAKDIIAKMKKAGTWRKKDAGSAPAGARGGEGEGPQGGSAGEGAGEEGGED